MTMTRGGSGEERGQHLTSFTNVFTLMGPVLGARIRDDQGQVTACLELFFFNRTSKLGQIFRQSAKSQLSFTSCHSQCGTI